MVNLIVPAAIFAATTIAGVVGLGFAGDSEWSILAALGSGALWIGAGIVLLRRYQLLAWSVSLLGWAAMIAGALQPAIPMISLVRRAQLGDRTAELDPGVGIVLFGSMLMAGTAVAAFVVVASLPRRRWGPSLAAQTGAPPTPGCAAPSGARASLHGTRSEADGP